MRIKRIHAKNYRTLEDTELLFQGDYCTLSGANNAGKSCVIRLLSLLFGGDSRLPYRRTSIDVEFAEDRTQWVEDASEIAITYTLEITESGDPGLRDFVRRIADVETPNDKSTLEVKYVYPEKPPQRKIVVSLDGSELADAAGKDIEIRLRESRLLMLYNSTSGEDDYLYGPRGSQLLYGFILSDDDIKAIDSANKKVDAAFKRIAKQQKEGLTGILGQLRDVHEVEFTPPEGYSSRHMPLGVKLNDKSVEVSLSEWGSGTQNRTRILMAVLQASRLKDCLETGQRVTPMVVVEEPESFLHPSAQAEFGRLLRALADTLDVQIVVTTHSPYMLNQEAPEANLLLSRKKFRRKILGTEVVSSSGENWMSPFSEQLGISPAEFEGWEQVFSAKRSRVLLVEGEIDKAYMELLQSSDIVGARLHEEIEVAPYGGKDTLKNTLLVGFVLRKFDHAFVTFDLDAKSQCETALRRLDLEHKKDFLPVGVNKPGKDCIEGLLPDSVLAEVNGAETELVMQLGSQDSSKRREAKNALKKKYLEKFKEKAAFSAEETKGLRDLVNHVNRQIAP